MNRSTLVSLEEYCRPFIRAGSKWPDLPLPSQPSHIWWQQWLQETPVESHFQSLRIFLPQLFIQPHTGASKSEAYKHLVLRGETDIELNDDEILQLNDLQAFSIRLADHICGPVPVIEIGDQNDFLNVVRCLAYCCEPKQIQPSVHAQAVAGLIHWGLIRTINQHERAQLIILHSSPYSSLPAKAIPGKPTTSQWLEISQHWRLEHELTHLTTQRLVGEMRLNLFDELIADSLGMLKALHLFSADLFRQGLGLNLDATTTKNGRVHTYLGGLDHKNSQIVCKYVLQRAIELEKLLSVRLIPYERIPLLRYLTQQTLDQPFLVPNHLANYWR